MNGILNVLKPPGMTSFDVVSHLRRVVGIKKIGHTGTLDPEAVGVLPICLGNATKAIEYMTEKDKLYRAELTLGISTDTQDSYGRVLDTREVSASVEEIAAAINEFVGRQKQVPPMYSAIKMDGKKLYELAREGVTVERKPRDVEIYSIKILDVRNRIFEEAKGSGGNYDAGGETRVVAKAIFDVHCSKGTYIRTLCHDIGEKMGCGGHMSFLLRLRAGSFDISSAVTLEEIAEQKQRNTLQHLLMDVAPVFGGFQQIGLNENEYKKFSNGVYIPISDGKYEEGEFVRVFRENTFTALGEVFFYKGSLYLKSKKFFL